MRIVVFAGLAASLVNFRGPLVKRLCDDGHEVHVLAPNISAEPKVIEKLRQMGVQDYHDTDLQTTGLNPVKDMASLLSLYRLLRQIAPDIILAYTIKPVIWGVIAGWLANVPKRVALITGLGYAFTGKASGKRKLTQLIARKLYKIALSHAHVVIFQNPDDAATFRQMGLLAKSCDPVIVNGSGVDLSHYRPEDFPEKPIKFLLIARLLGDKGIREYAQAAKQIMAKNDNVECHIVGGSYPSPDAIAQIEVEGWCRDFGMIWHGAVTDVRPYIANSHVYVLPSYREGTPRTVLEAMAAGRPIITTDAPGCRETVKDGVNGYLIAPRQVQPLAEAMQKFIDNPDLITKMGQASSVYVEEKYDVHKVNKSMCRAMGLE